MGGNDMLLAMKRGKLLGNKPDGATMDSAPVDPDATQDAMPPATGGGTGDPMMDLSQKVDGMQGLLQQIADKVGVTPAGSSAASPIPPMEQAAEMSE